MSGRGRRTTTPSISPTGCPRTATRTPCSRVGSAWKSAVAQGVTPPSRRALPRSTSPSTSLAPHRRDALGTRHATAGPRANSRVRKARFRYVRHGLVRSPLLSCEEALQERGPVPLVRQRGLRRCHGDPVLEGVLERLW